MRLRLPFGGGRDWTGVAALAAVAAVVALAVLAGGVTTPHLLEDATGEGDLLQQAKAAVNMLRQRPIATDDFSPVEHTGGPAVGANTFFEQEVDEAKVRRSMQMLKDAGVHWLRQEFPWDRIEQDGKGRFTGPFGSTWPAYDRIVRLAEEYQLELVVRLTLPPPWTRADNSVPRAPPDRYEDYGDFVAAVVQRYQGRVHYYQLWNEPNTVLEWGTPPKAADYVRLLRSGYQRAKAIDPSVTILAAALSPTIGTPDGSNENDLTYLQEMYDAGAAAYFDVMSAQGYGLFTGPGDRRADPFRTNFSRVQLVREVMVRNGDGRKPIWLAEMGWSALPLDFPGPALHGRVTEAQQARYTQQALERIQREWPWVGVTFVWHFRRVSDELRDQVDFYFRMVDPDFTPRPVYYAVQRAATALPVLRYGWRPVDDPAITTKGAWTPGEVTATGARVTTLGARTPSASLSFSYEGRALQVQCVVSDIDAALEVTVDGRPAGVLNVPGGRPGTLAALPVALAPADGVHTVTLRPAGTAPVEVAGFLVDAAQPSPVWDWLAWALLLATGAAGALTLRAARVER